MIDDSKQTATKATVNAKLHQAYDLNLKVKILSTGNIPTQLQFSCQPRQGAERIKKDPLDLPESTRSWLLEANNAVAAWLAKDAKNQLEFLADPMGAVQKAGVKMDRTRMKELVRLRENLGTAQAVVPGLQLRSIRTVKSTTDLSGGLKRGD